MTPEYDEELESYVTPDGCHYDTPQEAQYFHMLGLCGCGRPDEVHAFLIECAKCFDRGSYGLSNEERMRKWNEAGGVDGIATLVAKNPKVVAEFIAHFFDQRGLTEHGGSVYGSWLNADGYDFIEAGEMT